MPQPPAQPTTPPAPQPPADPPPTTPPAPADPNASAVPLDRFNQVIASQREAERERDALRQQLQEREDADKSEADRAKAQADREKARADKAESDLASFRRDNALRAAASTAGAVSPDAVVALANARGVQIDVDKPDTIAKAIADMKGTDETPGPDSALFGAAAPAAPAQTFGLPHAASQLNGGPGAQADPNEDPKLSLGQGLLAHIAGRR